MPAPTVMDYDDDNDCAEYYSRRADEIADWARAELKSAAVRDGLFVRLLLAKVERANDRDDWASRTLRGAVADAQFELTGLAERVAAAKRRVRKQLDPCADDLRSAMAGDGGGGGGGGGGLWGIFGWNFFTSHSLTVQNRRLAETARLRREKLARSLAAVRSVRARVQSARNENDRIRERYSNMLSTVPCD